MSAIIPEEQLKLIRVPTANATIYKDECVLTFDTPESDGGLYICLVTFYGFGEDYYRTYYEKTKHGVFLHHKRTKTELPRAEEGPEKKITRLAIGVEGGFAADSGPKYQYTDTYRILALPSDDIFYLEDPSLPAIVKLSADAVIASQSNFRKAELEALWDGECRQISKHANSLVQLNNGKKIPPSGWKCEKCELTSNLWLNLTDGSILCGRRAFDGTGGNNHGVQHYDNTGYPLAVKLGTITADGKADIYSYDEDDMVLDPNLPHHLQHFGIDINQLQKTDKSMTELEIDLNQRVGEWIACQESGSNLVAVYGPGRTGLTNLGNSCYLNSVMQVMFIIPSFVRTFVDSYPSRVEQFNFDQDPAKDFIIQMGKLGTGLCGGRYSIAPEEGTKKEQAGVSPRMFKQVVSQGNRDFMSTTQQDALEFFLHLYNVLERNCRDFPNPADVFKMKVEDRFQCVESGKVMYTNRTEYSLAVQIPLDKAVNFKEVEESKRQNSEDPKIELVRPIVKLQDCIDDLTQPENIDKFYSTAVKRHTVAVKSTRLATFPDYLMVHLRKFCAKEGEAVKINVAVDVPDILELENIRGKGIIPGEELLAEEEAPPVKLNMDVLNVLREMGCPEEPAKKAVFFTDGVGVQEAYNWYEEHLSDPTIMCPFVPPGSKPPKEVDVNEEYVAQIIFFGFSRGHAVQALRSTDGNLERAVDWAFNHPDSGQNVPIKPDVPEYTDGSPRYRLRAFITHMGPNANAGHYVCHILQDGQWIIFNDNKVALSVHPPRELAYLYLYERISQN